MVKHFSRFGVLSALFLAFATMVQADDKPDNARDLGRIVSVGGAVTETLYILGVHGQIVAVDTTSVHPPEALKTKESVGYMRQLSPEGIISTRPSLILLVEGSGPPRALDVLRQADVRIETIANDTSSQGAMKMIEQIAAIVGKAKQGALIVEQMRNSFERLAQSLAKLETRRKVLFLLSAAEGRFVAAGNDSSAASIISLAGAENAITSFKGYKPVSAEAIAEVDPDVILVMQRGGHAVTEETLRQNAMLAATRAVRNGKVILMDGSLLLSFGPRTAVAANQLARSIYPEAELPKISAPAAIK